MLLSIVTEMNYTRFGKNGDKRLSLKVNRLPRKIKQDNE